jgi:phosphonate transport system substrate-binding protein
MNCYVLMCASISASVLLGAAAPVRAQDSCPNRGQLDNLYCDADNDLIADVPTDARRLRDPSTLVFA